MRRNRFVGPFQATQRMAGMLLAVLLVVPILSIHFLPAPLVFAEMGDREDADDTVAFYRPDPDEIPPVISDWVRRHHRRQGTYRMNYEGKTWVLVAAGEKPTGGYGVEVVSARKLSDGKILFTVKLTSPGPGDMVIQALTYPYDLILLPETDAEFKFQYLTPSWIDLCPRVPDVTSIVWESVEALNLKGTAWEVICPKPPTPPGFHSSFS